MKTIRWSVAIGLFTGLTLAGCTWGTSGPIASPDGPDENSSPDQVEAARAETLRRIEAKRQAAEEVLAGRLTLADAANRFRAIRSELRQRYWESAGPFPPNSLEEEHLCREVIDYVRDVLRDRPAEAEPALARLEEELRAHLARLGLTPEMDAAR